MTKKMLVPVVPDNDGWNDERGWLIPLWTEDGITYLTVPGSKRRQFGLVVYTGKELSALDLLEKMRETEAHIPDIEKQRSILEEFLESVSNFRIGDIVCCADVDGKPHLKKKTSLVATVPKSRLP